MLRRSWDSLEIVLGYPWDGFGTDLSERWLRSSENGKPPSETVHGQEGRRPENDVARYNTAGRAATSATNAKLKAPIAGAGIC